MTDTRRRFLGACAGVLTLSPGEGRAAEEWMRKDIAQWDPADVQAVLTKSSWVKGVNPELSPVWLRANEKSGKRVAAAEGIRDKRVLTEFNLLIRWESGLPVRLARKGVPLPEFTAGHYALSVSRIPTSFIAATLGGPQAGNAPPDNAKIARQMLQSSSLQTEGKAPFAADHAEWIESDFEPRILIAFPQAQQPFQSQDRVVTFVSQAGPLMLRAAFPLGKMVFHGKLEL
jgi:hypothetical protein